MTPIIQIRPVHSEFGPINLRKISAPATRNDEWGVVVACPGEEHGEKE
jgi:hypothetical protein